MFSILLFACTDAEKSNSDGKTAINDTDNPLKEELFYPNGELKMRGETINGEKHGIWTSYFENGGIWSKNEFDHGVLHGSSVVFHKNGLPYYYGTYTKGEKSGEWSYYNEQGDLVKTVNYDEQ